MQSNHSLIREYQRGHNSRSISKPAPALAGQRRHSGRSNQSPQSQSESESDCCRRCTRLCSPPSTLAPGSQYPGPGPATTTDDPPPYLSANFAGVGGAATLRPRASTASLAPSAYGGADSTGNNSRPATRGGGPPPPPPPPTSATMYSNAQRADPSRPYNVPPPAPMSPPVMGQMAATAMNIPPPPPRYPSAPTTTGGLQLPPPPSGPPPSSTMGPAATWQGNWGRMYDGRHGTMAIPPPPSGGPHLAYNPRLHTQQSMGNLTIPPPPTQFPIPQTGEQSVGMSATYIPHGDTYGEGVGIPAFGPDDSTFSATSHSSWPAQGSNTETANTTPADGESRDRLYTNALNSQSRMLSTASNATNTPSNIPPEMAARWPLDHVLLWLASNQFSKDWQETFKALNLCGAKFLELGSGQHGRGNFGMMHQQVYPRLATECINSYTGWDPTREREEGKRMRRLVRNIVHGGGVSVSTGSRPDSHSRKDSLNASQGAGTDIESPNTPIKAPGPGFGSRRFSQTRSTTMPTLSSNTMSSDSNHRTLLKNLDVERSQRHSPGAGEIGNSSSRGSAPRSDSPGGSPKPNSAVFSHSTGNLSASSPSGRFGHRSRNSTDSVSSNAAIYGSGVPPEASAYLRSGLNGSRSPHEPGDRSAGTEPPASAKGDNSSLFGFLKRNKHKQREDGTFPSPKEAESPTSPELLKSSGTGGSHDAANFDALSFRSRKENAPRAYLLATVNGWDYRMCVVTDCETAQEIRENICANLGIHDPRSVQLYLTELGRVEHEEPLEDQSLVIHKRNKGDSNGSLKLFVRVGAPPPVNTEVPGSLTPGGQRSRSSSSPPTSRVDTVGDGGPDPNELAQKATAYKAEVEKQQQAYLAKRRQALEKSSPQDLASTSPYGIVGRNVDFDQPRVSPYEEKKQDLLFPQRKAPAPPAWRRPP
ncbi:hypothetical protein PG995_012417 [Apiospora arundinis]